MPAQDPKKPARSTPPAPKQGNPGPQAADCACPATPESQAPKAPGKVIPPATDTEDGSPAPRKADDGKYDGE